MHWHVVLKACELLCLLDPALSFFPFLFFPLFLSMGRGHPYRHSTGPCWAELPVPLLGSSVCNWLMDTVFAPRDTVLSKNRTAPHVALPSLGMAHDELPLWHQELTGLGAALVGAVLLKPCHLGLSHPMGISGLYQRSQKQSR